MIQKSMFSLVFLICATICFGQKDFSESINLILTFNKELLTTNEVRNFLVVIPDDTERRDTILLNYITGQTYISNKDFQKIKSLDKQDLSFSLTVRRGDFQKYTTYNYSFSLTKDFLEQPYLAIYLYDDCYGKKRKICNKKKPGKCVGFLSPIISKTCPTYY